MNETFLTNWIEYDYNPFILFDSDGVIVNLNQSAQFLISKVEPKILYDLALAYASRDYGFKTSFIDLRYDMFNFFAITVGYENDQTIGIKFYQSPYSNPKKTVSFRDYELSNIYLLIDAAILGAKSQNNAIFKKELDPTLPDFRLSQNRFVKILGKVYEFVNNSSLITTALTVKVGEFLQLDNKKYQILELKVSGDSCHIKDEQHLEALATDINIYLHFTQNTISLGIPIIL